MQQRPGFTPDVVLLDESDAIIFADPVLFYKKITKWQAKAIGFTAREFVGNELMNEKHVLDEMQCLTIHSNPLSEQVLLNTDATVRLTTSDEVKNQLQ